MWCNRLLKGLAFGLILVSAAFAQPGFNQGTNYTITVDYNGNSLYYQVGTNRCTQINSRGGSYTTTFQTSSPEQREIAFYSDRNCRTALTTPVTVAQLFGEETTASIKIDAVPGAEPAEPGAKPGTGAAADAGKIVIRFMPHWTNTSAILKVNGQEEKTMTKVQNYCGWFETKINPPEGSLLVTFKQTIGFLNVGNEGAVIITDGKDLPVENYINLDSIKVLGDTLWVRSFSSGIPEQYASFPGVLGDCPIKRFPVTMFDWKHGPKDNDGDGEGKNGDPANGTSADFGSGGCSGSPMKGMVQTVLGPQGVPVPADPFPENCRITEHLANWFIPEPLATSNGQILTNQVCRDLYISMDDEGFWYAEISKDHISEGNEANKGGMFLLDNFQYLDDPEGTGTGTIKNPYYDQQIGGQDNAMHNFGFTMKIQATFEYVPGQYFEFLGDDDVWVFINNRLVVDIGGQHAQVKGSVDLDTLGLQAGGTYNFHIFYAERHVSSSNFKMRTSIDLKSDATMFLTSNLRNVGLTDYTIWQINQKGTFSCGVVDATEVDTTGGPSTFKLLDVKGGSELLEVGKTYYGGLTITSDTTFTIDSALFAQFVQDNSVYNLMGHNFLQLTLKSDPSQTAMVEIVVPTLPKPNVAFADANWKIISTDQNGSVSGDKAQIGQWAGELYPVNITFLEEWAVVNNYNKKIDLSASTSLIGFYDKDGNPITSVVMSDDKKATFYVRASDAVTGATIFAGGSYWTKLNFAAPPIPRVVEAYIYDRNGDGRGDSIWIQFDREIGGKDVLDSLQPTFGETFKVQTKTRASGNIVTLVSEGSCRPYEQCGFGTRQFTGGEGSVYTGHITTWFTHTENGQKGKFSAQNEPLSDAMGPIIVKAVKTKMKDGNRELTITLSEAIDDQTRNFYKEMFEYQCIRNGKPAVPEKPIQVGGSGNVITLIFPASTADAVYPSDGDKIRLVPGKQSNMVAMDLLGLTPHESNPWVVITGDQEVSNDSPGLVVIDVNNPIVQNDTTTQPVLITDPTKDAQGIGDSLGVQGNLIDFDISQIMVEQTKKDIETLDKYIALLTGSDVQDTIKRVDTTYIMSRDDAISQVLSDLITDPSLEGYVTEEVKNKILTGEINKDNYAQFITGEDKATIDKMVQDNIDLSVKTETIIIPPTIIGYDDIFNKIATGEISEASLLDAGVSQMVIDAIKNGTLTTNNVPSYRQGEQSLVQKNSVVLQYRTRYYSHLGGYVGGDVGTISCEDNDLYGGDCLNTKGRLFLAWNMRSDKGQLVGTGVYIARLELKIRVNGKIVFKQVRDKLLGVRRPSKSSKANVPLLKRKRR